VHAAKDLGMPSRMRGTNSTGPGVPRADRTFREIFERKMRDQNLVLDDIDAKLERIERAGKAGR
jgi:hypothetical protein